MVEVTQMFLQCVFRSKILRTHTRSDRNRKVLNTQKCEQSCNTFYQSVYIHQSVLSCAGYYGLKINKKNKIK